MRKLFRFHRGGLQESLETMVEVEDFIDIAQLIAHEFGSIASSDISTDYACDDSARIGEEWKETYYVLAKYNDTPQCVGMSNFPKDY